MWARLSGVALVAAAGLILLPSDQFPTARLFLLVFAATCVLFGGASTTVVRWAGAGVALAGALWPAAAPLVTLSVCFLWPLGLIAAWATAADDAEQKEPLGSRVTGPRLGLAAGVLAVGAAVIVYRSLVAHHLEQSAALFVGIPAIVAVAVILVMSPRSATGVILKALTVALLLSAMFLWEGVLCIVMAAPLFYVIGIAVGVAIDAVRRRGGSATLQCAMVLLLVPLSLEDAVTGIGINHRDVVSSTRIVRASVDDVRRALAAPPRFDRELPFYLRAGFPAPVATRVTDRDGAPQWTVAMRGGEMRINGMEPRTGALVLTVTEERDRYVHWRVDADDSHMTHFLFWREASVEWEPIDARTTRVTWTLAYDRGLAPSWYFAPWEQYAVRLAAGYLIDAVATP